MQEVSVSSVKLSPFMLVILARYPFLFHKVVCKIISISVVFSHSLQCNNCCIFFTLNETASAGANEADGVPVCSSTLHTITVFWSGELSCD